MDIEMFTYNLYKFTFCKSLEYNNPFFIKINAIPMHCLGKKLSEVKHENY